jgi:hypothetical protein
MIVGERMGPSVVMLDTDVPAGAFSSTVGGGKCSFILTVTASSTS